MTKNDMIVTPESIHTAGSISYWRLSGAVNLDKLAEAWKAAGLNPEQLPKAPGNDVALGRAVREEQSKRVLVRPLARRGAWAVVQETVVKKADEQEPVLAYTTLATVKFDNGPTFTRVAETPTAYEERVMRIRTNYDRHQGELAQEDISAWLVKIAGVLQSVPLRDTGGIYFVPRGDGVMLWRRIVTVLTSVSDHKVFQIPALRNSEAIDAITDAITQEVDAITTAMRAELEKTGEEALGARALATRKLECDVLLAKVTAYDELLGRQLQCRERVEELSAMVATAALLDMGEAA